MKFKSIENIGNVVSGSTPKRLKPEYWNGNINWASLKDISKLTGPYLTSTLETITELGYKSCSTQLLPEGTVLLSSRAPIGHLAVSKIKVCTNQGFKSIIPNDGVNSLYLYFALKYKIEAVKDLGTGTTFTELSKKRLEKFELPFPETIEDQKRIAQVLTDCEELISKRKESITLLDELLKSTFLELFGDPVKNEKGWEKDILKEIIGAVITGNTPPRKNPKNYSSDNLEWIKTDNIVRGAKYLTNAKEYLSESGIKKGRAVEKGALLVTCIAGSEKSIGNCSLTDRKVAFNQQINAIVPFDDIHPEFLYWMFVIFENYIKSYATKGMKKIITKGEFEKINLFKPDYNIQQEFAKISEKVEETKKLYKNHLAELENLYGRLSQDAFKGELDLSKVVLREEFLNDVETPDVKDNLEAEKESKDSQTFSKTLFNLDKIDTYLENLIKNNFDGESFVFDDIKDLLFQNFKIEDYQDKYDRWKTNFFGLLKKENSQIEQYFDTQEGRIKFKLKDEVNQV